MDEGLSHRRLDSTVFTALLCWRICRHGYRHGT